MEQKTLKNQNKKALLCLIGIILLVVAAIMLILYFLRGETSIDNSGGDYDAVQSITCEGNNVDYPLIKSISSESNYLKIIIVTDKDKLKTVSLTRTIIGVDGSNVENSRAKVRYEMNKHFDSDNLSPDSFSVTYSSVDDGFQVRLFAELKDLNGMTYKYFLLENAGGNLKKDNITKIYNEKGLNCVINN